MTFSPKATPEQRAKAITGLIETLAQDDRPIILGPWRSELGFEALYWLPFLRKLAAKVPNFEKRAVALTRGGMAACYPAAKAVDLYTLRSVTEIRRENLYDRQMSGLSKQMRPTAWDEAAIRDAASALGLGALYHTVHPAWMYWGLEPFWNEARGLRHLLGLADYTPIQKPALPDSIAADLKYVAVKFYARSTFNYPDPHIAEFVTRTVSNLASQTNVVLLNSSSAFDDHSDIPLSGPNIHRLPEDVPPEQNLWLQASVLAHATAFVGTYGGVSQLALRMGVPSVSFWHGNFTGTAHAHLSLSSWLSQQTRTPFLAGSTSDSVLWAQVVGGVMVQRKEQAA